MIQPKTIQPLHMLPWRHPVYPLAQATPNALPSALPSPATLYHYPLHPLFGRKQDGPSPLTKHHHASDARGDDYSRYTAQNTILPPASYHLFLKADSQTEFWKLGQALEEYIAGKRYIDIPFIQKRATLQEEPFVVFDTETTGIEATDRILQLAALPVVPTQDSQGKFKGYRIDYGHAYNELFHPGYTQQSHGQEMFPIHPKAQAVHHISPESLQDKPTIDQRMGQIRQDILKERAVVVAYNAKFDVEKFNAALHNYNMDIRSTNKRLLDRALVVDPFVLIQRLHPFCSQKKTLSTHYKILMGRALENQHDALADVGGTVDLLKYIFLYLEKHTIPKPWGEAVRAYLRDKKIGKEKWAKLDTAQQAATIATFVRLYRPLLEKRIGTKAPEPLRFIDILRFQHGSLVYQADGELPMFDITLNRFGIDGAKQWDGSDCLDAEVVERVRKERDAENRALLLDTFLEKASEGKVALPKKQQAAWSPLLKATLGPEVVNQFLAKSLPDFAQPASLKAWQTDLQKLGEKALTQEAKGQKLSPTEQEALLNAGMAYATQQAQALQQAFGHRAFYTYVPVQKPEELIDPAVRRSASK